MVKTVFLTIAYDGTPFSGWQRQPGQRTVQGEIEKVLDKLLGCKVTIEGSGRTDAGVHATGQTATFEGELKIPMEKLAFAVNNLLPGSIRILKAEEVRRGFHARFDASGKTYTYLIANSNEKNPFYRNRLYYVAHPLDKAAMERAAKSLVGTHDFKCFEGAGGNPRKTTVRTITSLNIDVSGQGIDTIITISATGDGFLYKMVRNIVGTLVEVGLGKLSCNKIEEIIFSKDRGMAGHTAPPQGLYLKEVHYHKRGIVKD